MIPRFYTKWRENTAAGDTEIDENKNSQCGLEEWDDKFNFQH